MEESTLSSSSLSLTSNDTFTLRIKEFFELAEEDELIKDFECYILKSFLLKGTLYILKSHLCFHASLGLKEKISFQGWMNKKSRRTLNYKRYYFILRNDELAWFENPNDLYFPVNSILLAEVIHITTSKSNPKVFRIGTCARNFSFMTASNESLKEWMQVLQRAVFTSVHDGNDIKIVIPYSHITELQHTSTNDDAIPQCLICHIKDEDYIDEYYFCNFFDYTALRNILDSAYSNYSIPSIPSPMKDNLPDMDITTNSLRQLHMTSSKSSLAVPKHRTSLPSIDGSFLKWFKPDENELKQFPIPTTEEIQVKAITYFVKWMPIRGTIYLTNNFLCFKSLAGFKLKAVIPIRDILTVDEQQHKYALHNGLGITTMDGKRLLFEFYDDEKRLQILAIIQHQIKHLARSHSANSMTTALQDVLQDIHTNDTHFKLSRTNSLNVINSFNDTQVQPLKIVFLTIGSRGDVQPFIALALRFKQDGHACTIATHSEYKEWIEKHGILFKDVKGDPSKIMQLCINHSLFSIQFIRTVFGNFREWLDELLLSSYEACKGCDCLIESGGSLAGIHIVEKLQIPYFRAFMMPWTRNTMYPHPFATPSINMGNRYNYSTYLLFDQMMWQVGYYVFDHFREHVLELKTKNWSNLNAPFLYGFSPTVVPSAPEWQDIAYVTGYWFLNEPIDYNCPTDLLTFFDTKIPIVYIGFGSIIVDDPIEMTRIISEAVLKANIKAVVCKGWSSREHQDKDTTDYSSHLYITDSIPHDWLFSRVQAVCHHGGSGTTAAGLKHGKPTIIKPFFGDQFFWGQRIEELGVGVMIKKLTIDKLSDALLQVTQNEIIMTKADKLGQQIRQEKGVETALNVFYSRLGQAKEFVDSLQ